MGQDKIIALFDYVQSDMKVPEHPREKIANFPHIFKNRNVYRQEIGPLMRDYAEKNELMSQPERMIFF